MTSPPSTLRPLRGLRLDLSRRTCSEEQLPADVARAYLGGRGLGAYLALRERLFDVEPFAPENLLIFAPGPLTGTGAPASGRYSVTSRSPLTGTVFDGNSGGNWGNALRRLGWDYLVVGGALDAPGYVTIGLDGDGDARVAGPEAAQSLDGDGGAVLRPAADLWGLDVPETLARVRELHPKSEAAVIGPAGERGVLFGSIVNNRGRSIGRGGLGAVMGSKRLKALVVSGRGDRKPPVADPERLEFIVYEAEKLLKANPITSTALPEFGTSVLVNVLDQAGALPTRNHRESRFEGAAAISGEALKKHHVHHRSACRGCIIGCARRTTAGSQSGEGPEYESIWAFGAECGVSDLTAIVQANYACNRAGMDTITMGVTIACAMDLAEEGLLPGGPRFGDARAIIELAEATATGEGLGAELGLGSARFAALHGRPELSMSVKRLEMPAYDPRGMKAQGLAYATSNRGGCHLRANMLGPEILGIPKMVDRFATLGKAGLLINIQNLNAVLDSLSVCKFTAFAMKEDYYARQLSAVWGETVEPQELLLLGERIWNTEHLFNLAAGFTRADDTLPPRLLHEPVPAGPSAGQVVDLPPMLDEYYISRGWDAGGVPSAAKLERLGLTATAAAAGIAAASAGAPDEAARAGAAPETGTTNP
ncbi:MAG TPA: aldehyde ferredoxin oxidoreductase family protein [Thermoleophilia bacterium]|nr:aldehyde ferredoxin oxidoreductase family protein [Thermoleophilia bacterium]